MLSFLIPIIAITTWLSSHVFFSSTFDPQKEPYIPPPKAIKNFTAGFNVQMADSFWLRAVQDFDHCSEQIKQNECAGKSWLYDVLDIAAVLDPKLEPAMYQTGGLALTVIISDYAGASDFFDRGVKEYPEVWQLTYAAAYHALYEEKNKAKASQLYFLAHKYGGPSWLPVMAGRLATESGEIEFAEKVLEEMINQNTDEALIKRLKLKLAEARSKKSINH